MKKTFKRTSAFVCAMAVMAAPMTFSSFVANADGETVTSDYTLTIPATLTVANSGWNATDGVSATGTLEDGKKLVVTATSDDEFALVNQDDNTQKIGYKLATASTDTTATTSWEFTELSSTAATKPMGIIVDDYSTAPAGTYTDTVTFTAKVENNPVSFTIKRDVSMSSSGNYTVAPGTTWRQFIGSGNAPASVTISSLYVGHDYNDTVSDCGGTILCNTADNRFVRPDEAIIDGATYACDDYVSYEGHD